MNSGNRRRLFAAVVLLLPLLGLLMGARNMPRLEAPRDLVAATPGESILIDVLANDGVLGEGLVLQRVNRPLRGTAVVEGGQVRYTAASGEGSDRFGYVVQLADGRTALGVVDVRVQSLPLGTHLKGLVPAHVGAGATVRLRLGGNVVHETLTRVGGHFTVVLPAGIHPSDTLMSVDVAGLTDAGVPARWYSLLGTVGSFSVGWQGPDDENHWNLRVGPFSTAHHALLSRVMSLPGGAAEDYRKHLSSVDPMMMLRLATVFAMVAEGEVALPAGQSDAYALITDLGALDALVDALPEGVFEARQAAVLADRRLIQRYGFSVLTSLYADGALMRPGGAGLVELAGSEVAELSGTQYIIGVPRTLNSIQRVADDGWMRLVMHTGAIQRDFRQQQVVCPSGMWWTVQMSRAWDEETLVGLFRGEDVSYMLRLRDVTLGAQTEGVPPDCLSALPEPQVVGERVGTLMYPWSSVETRSVGFDPGRHYLAASTSAMDRTPRSGWMDVPAGIGGFDTQELTNPPLWYPRGYLDFGMVDQQGGYSFHGANMIRQASGAQEWLVRVLSSTANSSPSVYSTPGVNADPDLGVVDFNGVWMNGPTTSDLSMGRPDVTEFLVALDVAAGTGVQISRPPGGASPGMAPVWLEVGDTTMAAFSFRTSNGEFVGECPPEDSGCLPWRRRDWQVLRVLHDHFGAGRHLMWVDERVRVGFFDGEWAADLRRVMPYMLTGDPLPDMADDTLDATVPVRSDLGGHSGRDRGLMRH